MLLLALLVVVQCAALAADQVLVQAAAAQVARAAAVGQPGEQALRDAGVYASARVEVERRRVAGDAAPWVRVEVRVTSRAFRAAGVRLEVVGRAAARAETSGDLR